MRLTVTLSFRKNAFYTQEVNIPTVLGDVLTEAKVMEHMVGRAGNGIKRHDLENQSITPKIIIFPSDDGRSVTKSTARCDLGCSGMAVATANRRGDKRVSW